MAAVFMRRQAGRCSPRLAGRTRPRRSSLTPTWLVLLVIGGWCHPARAQRTDVGGVLTDKASSATTVDNPQWVQARRDGRPTHGIPRKVPRIDHKLLVKPEAGLQAMYVVQFNSNTPLTITGSARPTFLQDGMFVQFVGKVNAREGRVVEPVGNLTIITPSQLPEFPQRWPGVFLPGAEGQPVKPELAKGGAAAGGSGDAMPKNYDLRGQIAKLRAGRFELHIPNPYFRDELRVELAESPTINLNVADLGIVRPGDYVEATGSQNKTQPSLVSAQEVTIKLQAPLGELTPEEKRARLTGRQPEQEAGGLAPPSGDTFEVAQQMADRDELEAEADQENEQTDPIDAPADDRFRQDAADPADDQIVVDTPPEPSPVPSTLLSPEQRADAITKLVRLDPPPPADELVRARLGTGPVVTLMRTQPVTSARLRREFGLPETAYDITGRLPVDRGRSVEAIEWDLWDYGGLQLLIDDAGVVRYITGDEE